MRTMNPKFSQTMTPKQSYKSAVDRARQGRQEAMQQVRSMPKGPERQAARQQAMDSFRSAVKSARDQRGTPMRPDEPRIGSGTIADPRPGKPSYDVSTITNPKPRDSGTGTGGGRPLFKDAPSKASPDPVTGGIRPPGETGSGGGPRMTIDRGGARPENTFPSRPAGFQDMSTMASAPMSTPPAPMKKGGKASVVKTASKGRKCDW